MRVAAAMCLLAAVWVSKLSAAESADRWAVPVPVPFAYPVPEWADTPVVENGFGTTSLHVPVVASAPDRELVVTVYFNESAGGFVRVQWSGTSGAVTLAGNLFEGVGGPHQRSLLIPSRHLGGPGVLTVTSDGVNCLYQVELEWLTSGTLLAGEGSESVPDAVLAGGRYLDRTQLLGGTAPSLSADTWDGDIINAPLTDRIERIEDGLIFVVPLSRVPEQARLALWIAGPPVASELRLQVNGQDVGPVAFHVPSLTDLGYYRDSAGEWYYAGWRKGTIAIRQSLLGVGDNEIGLVEVSGDRQRAVAVKSIVLQLRYPAAAGSADSANSTGSGSLYDDVSPEDLTGRSDAVETDAQSPVQFLLSEPDILPLD